MFMAGDKRANKNIATRNYELYQCTDLRDTRVIESSLSSLEKFQKRNSGWALCMAYIINLTVNAKKHNSARGMFIKLPREIMLKRAVKRSKRG